ncbi:Rrf2 family transcriptional regulator [Dialister sp.]|uniref:Rrf2 family transcriptional regulator n=1 Tax=Dialister sp. TaxID=1955814 RepID=UPI00406D5094
MQISSRFTIAVHMLCYIALFQDKEKVTSDIMAGSINANPVVVRRLLSQLKQRGMVTVNRGSGGAFLAMKPEDLDFLQIYRTVETVEKGRYLPFPRKPESQRYLSWGRGIHQALDSKLMRVQEAMAREMKSITLADVLKDFPIEK